MNNFNYSKASNEEILNLFDVKSNNFKIAHNTNNDKINSYFIYNDKIFKYCLYFFYYKLELTLVNGDIDISIFKLENDIWNEITYTNIFNELKNKCFYHKALGLFIVKPNKKNELCEIIRFVYKLDNLNIFS